MEIRSIKFAQGPFHAEIRRRVEAHLSPTGAGRDSPRMYIKAAVIVGWLVASYLVLMFRSTSWLSAIPLSLSVGLATAGIGFNLMHDGGHGAYSRFPAINRAMALSLEVLGGSSAIWRWKHNVIHHTYPNLGAADNDLDVGPWARLAPHQPRRWMHRYQQIYMWLLFGLLPFKWWIVDIRNFRRGVVGTHRLPPLPPVEKAVFVAGKVLLPLWALFIPCLLHPVWQVVTCYVIAFFTTGIVLSVTFQLAHCVAEAQTDPLPASGRVALEWAAHQVETAVDFAPGNRFLGWYLGGLNYQIEHHLFPQISHVHYPAIAPIVQQACREHGVRYTVHPTFARAIAGHFRWLRRMGRAEDTEAVATMRRAS